MTATKKDGPTKAATRAEKAEARTAAKADQAKARAVAKEQAKAAVQAEKDAIAKARADAKAAGKPLSKRALAKVKADAKASRKAKVKAAKATQAETQKASVGRVVHYVLDEVNGKGEHEVRPAIVVRIPEVAETDPTTELEGVIEDKPGSGTRAGAAARRAAAPVKRKVAEFLNLVVFCDGQNDRSINDAGGSAWISNVLYDEDGAPGTWHWPLRV